ncbi:hypothetical protein HMPREF9304_08560 [Hoylesella timonensis S9-PR14]|uniref:Uncharacterized protein n=1 Tax=Hoylesella timonensis S9-PR14 TaxID=1401062 RepID=A0A098YQT5_9BACT|nr:hypothetical protein HMPREF9304_08560 [Hoylesella timonensis S9-PR14]
MTGRSPNRNIAQSNALGMDVKTNWRAVSAKGKGLHTHNQQNSLQSAHFLLPFALSERKK